MAPKVSVVLPTYNRASLLKRAIKSILNQTYQDFEMIIVDDGSTDNTENVVKGFGNEGIRYISHDNNRGAGAARNTGIKVARGRYIAFLDSDNQWLPEKLEKQMQFIQHKTEDVVVYTDYWDWENRRHMLSHRKIQKDGDIHDILLEDNFIDTSTVLVSKECLHKAGLFDETLPRYQDWELWIRLSKYYRFVYLDEPLAKVHFTPGCITSNDEALLPARRIIFEKHFEDIAKRPDLLARHLYALGCPTIYFGEFTEGRNYLWRAVKTYPWKPRYLITAFLALFGRSFYLAISRTKRRVVSLIKANHISDG